MNNFIVTLSLTDSTNCKVKEYHINLKFVSFIKVEFGKVSIYVGDQVIDIDDNGTSDMRKKFLAAWEEWKSSFVEFSLK